MRIAVASRPDGGGVLCPMTDDGTPGPAEEVADLAAAIGARERQAGGSARWVWPTTAHLYPRLLRSGVTVARCHDLELVETLLLGHAGRYGEPRSVAAAWARLRGGPVPADPPPVGEAEVQPSLFDRSPVRPAGDELARIIAVHADQRRRMRGAEGLPVLAAAESAGALAAAEMSHEGLPWRADRHDALLTEMLGPRPTGALRPRRLQSLADGITDAFGARTPVNPDSPGQILKAFSAAGLTLPSTRARVLERLDHPAVPLLLEYKELSRLHTAHGWSWLDTWVAEGRFRPEYVVGGVVSGRWASRGGGALQIPRVLRRAVVADPGHVLLVADAAQLEPRVLAALAGDRAFAAAAAHGDLYAALAAVFGGADARAKAKIALLSAMYGGGTGEALQLLAILRHRFPDAFAYIESAARAGEEGRLVRSRLGRTCPPPSAGWRALTTGDAAEAGGGRPASMPGRARADPAAALRSRGRFTRNFVVQATAAEWALIMMAVLRGRLRRIADAHLVFFQHDEVIVHAPEERAASVRSAIHEAAAESGRTIFGPTPVVFPMEVATVTCYADAK